MFGKQVSAQDGPLPPQESLKRFQLAGDLKIELIASEPMVKDPVACAWDAQGRLFVVEMGDYPVGPPNGRVKLLLDENRDGVIDRDVVFADQLAYPTSVLPYGDGVLIAAAPDIWFMLDTDGDYKADIRRRVVTGFHEGNQQLRVNGLVLGMDQWIYGANGRSDGNLRLCDMNGQPYGDPLPMRGHDFRFRPETSTSRGKLEITGGFSQFGLAMDDWGERFTSWNTIPIRHVVMEQQQLQRNSNAPLFQTMQEILADGSTPRIYPLSSTTPRFNAEPPGYFNASCGLAILRGDALPDRFQGNAFMCEPLSNLVHREVLTRDGATFSARRADDEPDREFLASADRWFRPVNLATGPDGALYVVDFYRAWVEHPQFVADKTQRETVDFAEGREFGRIYRVSSKIHEAKAYLDFTKLELEQLVEQLSSPIGWRRETAHTQLLTRFIKGNEKPKLAKLKSLLSNTIISAESAFARYHGHLLLAEIDPTPEQLAVGLKDKQPSIRRLAVRISSEHSMALDQMREMVRNEPDRSVLFQAAKSIGDFQHSDHSTARAEVLIELMQRAHDDAWFRRAIESSMAGVELQVLSTSLARQNDEASKQLSQAWSTDALLWLAELISNSSDTTIATWLPKNDSGLRAFVTAKPNRIAVLAVLERFSRRNQLAQIDWHDVGLTKALQTAEVLAGDSGYEPAQRILAIRLLAFCSTAKAKELLTQLCAPEQPREVQLAAIWSLTRTIRFDASSVLVEAIGGATPEIRRAIVEALFARESSPEWLIAALESNKLTPRDIDPTQQRVIVARAAAPTNERLEKLLQASSSNQTRETIAKYITTINEKLGDTDRGAKLVTLHCANCHAVQGKGNRVGPDLATVAGRAAEDLVYDILDPNRSVSNDFLCYLAVTSGGRILTGLNGGESAASVTLRRPGGLDETILREELSEFRTLGQSLMPVGFEQSLSPQDVSDVIAFIKSGKPLP